MSSDPHVLAMVLAGGEGKRLMPLTADRAKPAVPFGGSYRLVDFVLSNLINAGLRRVCVLTQYKSHSLDRHITQTWRISESVSVLCSRSLLTTAGDTCCPNMLMTRLRSSIDLKEFRIFLRICAATNPAASPASRMMPAFPMCTPTEKM